MLFRSQVAGAANPVAGPYFNFSVPEPTGVVAVLAPALDALLRGDERPAAAYSASCLDRVWRSTHFSWWMTTMLHRTPGANEMETQLQLSQLRYTVSSRAAATSLAENYTGFPVQLTAEPRQRVR